MNLDWLLNPLVSYALIAVALAACIGIFISYKSELYRLRRAAAATQNDMKQQIEHMQSTVAQIGQQRQEAREPAVVSRAALRPSLNLTRRTQALRMRRRGESVESIAAALATPRNEIELMLKVYEMLEYRRQLKAPAEPVA